MIKQKLWDIEKDAKDKDKISALKALLDELNHEARVLRLIDVSKTINNYVHIEKMGIMVQQIVDVVKEFVPLEKQEYALRRIKSIGTDVLQKKEK